MTLSLRSPSRFIVHLLLTQAMFIVFAISFVIYYRAEKQIDRANELRLQSFQLAEELRQSSDDLTRMVRTYVVTGEPIHKRHYQEILDIRDGKLPRPLDYQNVYWDLVLADDIRPSQSGPAVALLDLMRRAGFSDEEFAKLAEAKANSDALTRSEYAAMALVETATPVSQVNRTEAIRMLHDTAYHQAKAGIMQPIRQFNLLADQRTLANVQAAERHADRLRTVFIGFGVLLALLLWNARRSLHAILGGTVDALYERIANLGHGDFSTPIPVAKGMENTVLGWLSATQIKLARLDAERKAAESGLKQHQDHLEAVVAARTAELSAAKDAAEIASRAKSTFLANMSHELRTPMNAIMGMTSLALRRAEDPKLKDQLGKIGQASQHLLAIINDILDISKIEADRLTLDQVNFTLGEVLENIRSLIGHKVVERGLQLRVELPAELAALSFQGDPLRLSQILLNLGGNAVKFTKNGAICVRAHKLDEDPDAMLLYWEVQDSGIGIASADQARLFTAFEQADGSMTRKYGGTGLGLAISKRLAHLMGGEIGMESAPGQGSTFWFTVRLARAAAAVDTPASPHAAAASAEAQLKQRHAGARILLAEDEPVNQEVSRGLLEEVGFAVDLAADGAIAVALAQSNRYDLILMDMQMPNLNGVEATRAIRAASLNARTPILATTANVFEEDRQVCIDAGMNGHIAKPIDPDRLFETLLKWLSRPEPVSIGVGKG